MMALTCAAGGVGAPDVLANVPVMIASGAFSGTATDRYGANNYCMTGGTGTGASTSTFTFTGTISPEGAAMISVTQPMGDSLQFTSSSATLMSLASITIVGTDGATLVLTRAAP
jgi:hypothetical protein